MHEQEAHEHRAKNDVLLVACKAHGRRHCVIWVVL